MSKFYDQMKSVMNDRVIIVTGAPGSGKTTFAKETRRAGDIVIDLDYLAAALMASENPHDNRDDVLDAAFFLRNQLIDAIKNNRIVFNRAIIIATNDARDLKAKLGGIIVDVDKGYKDTFDRIENDKTTNERERARRREYAIQYYSDPRHK